MELKSWETLTLFELEAEKAVNEHNAALAKLRRNGQPIFADNIMREHETAARAKLTAKLDELTEKVGILRARAEAAAEAGGADEYAWLTTEELQRAALLAPFVAEDVAAADVGELARLGNQTMTGKRKLDRPMAWLLMRAAARRDGVPGSVVRAFETAAMPPEIAAFAKEAQEARSFQDRIAKLRPEYKEHIRRDIMAHANYDATGQPVEML
jgi:hypothetical protein